MDGGETTFQTKTCNRSQGTTGQKRIEEIFSKVFIMPTYLTPNRHGYSVRFSPFRSERIVCATSQYYGLAGGGTLFVLDKTDSSLVEVARFPWQDGLFDVVWSETEPDVVVTASGDGILQIWNIAQPHLAPELLKEHKKEVYSVDWSQTRQENLILSASWDCSVKLWDPHCCQSLSTFLGHSQLVYNAMWSPHIPSCFSSVSGDGTMRIWNLAVSGGRPQMSLQVHDAEVLSCSWCKYDSNIIATAGSDGLIRGWDLRVLTLPIFEQRGHEYAVRRIQFSPHRNSVMASVSYDFTTRIWDYKVSSEAVEIVRHHTEFVYGLDFSNHNEGELADCGWDSLLHVYVPQSLRPLHIDP